MKKAVSRVETNGALAEKSQQSTVRTGRGAGRQRARVIPLPDFGKPANLKVKETLLQRRATARRPVRVQFCEP